MEEAKAGSPLRSARSAPALHKVELNRRAENPKNRTSGTIERDSEGFFCLESFALETRSQISLDRHRENALLRQLAPAKRLRIASITT